MTPRIRGPPDLALAPSPRRPAAVVVTCHLQGDGRNIFEEDAMTTIADHTARREELLARLATQAEELRFSEGWRNWLRFAVRFRHYSLRNQLLIQSQRPDATLVAGFRTWRDLGRTVKKGEHAIGIIAPMVRRGAVDATADEDGDEEPQRILRGFKVVNVFDVSQTEGDRLPSHSMPTVTIPDWRIRDALIAATERAGFRVDLVDAAYEPGVRGWYDPRARAISLVQSYTTASQARTLLHELAHAHDPLVPGELDDRPNRELVAESVAFLVGVSLDMDLSDASTFYVTSWGGDREQMNQLAAQVLEIAGRIDEVIADLPKRSA
jgi:antirestriction protein ArdC